jgi:type I restriction enzyme S subunit
LEGRSFPGGSLARGFSLASVQWPLERAGNLVTLNYGKSLVEATRTPGKIPVFGTNGRCGWNGQALAKGPGVILGRKGMGPLGVEWNSDDFWVIDTAYYAVPRSPELDLKFFYYLAKYVGLNHLKDGTSNPTLSREAFYSQVLPLPPPEQQRAIASILSALDDKIELNRRLNETLEAMARAIFKSWFVEFDPVRAKAEGRQPAGMDAETAALFTDSFEESVIDKIPRGWKAVPLDDVADFRNGLAMQRFPASENGHLPVIRIAELNRGDTGGADRASASLDPLYVVDDGDVLFSWSGSLVVRIWCGGRGALNQHLFKVTSTSFPRWFFYFWLLEHLPDFQLTAAGKATTMGHIQRHHLHEASVVVPPQPLLDRASQILEPLLNRFVANNVESRALAALRDVLLPKLLSGEVSVGDAGGMFGWA